MIMFSVLESHLNVGNAIEGSIYIRCNLVQFMV